MPSPQIMFQIHYKNTDPAWYAMKASYGRAIKAKERLDSMQIENYVPMRYDKKRVNNRTKTVPVAAIPSLIFVKADLFHLNKAKEQIDFLHNMLIKSADGNSLEPIIVPELEMTRFMTIVADAQEKVKFVDLDLNSQIISAGTRVRVTGGKYEGYEGILCRPKGSRAKKVLIDLCGLAPVEMPVVDIELLEEI